LVIHVEFKAYNDVILYFGFLFNIERIKALECLLLLFQIGPTIN